MSTEGPRRVALPCLAVRRQVLVSIFAVRVVFELKPAVERLGNNIVATYRMRTARSPTSSRI